MEKKITRGTSIVLISVLSVATLIPLFVTSVQAQEWYGRWRTEIVDDGGLPTYIRYVGLYTSIALDSNDYPHISYHDDTLNVLKYASWDGMDWNIEIVDSQYGVDVGKWTSIALDSNDYPHISYKCTFSYYEAYLKYARWNGITGEWIIETVPPPPTIDFNVGWFSSIALDSNGYPHISYCDSLNDDLWYAWRDGSGWHTETVPDPSDRVGWYSSIALDSNDQPHISYYDITENDLKHAWYDGSDWHIEKPDINGQWGVVGVWTSIALDSNDHPHISYYGQLTNMIWPGHYLKHAWWDGDEWRDEDVMYSVNWDCYTSIALDSGDNIHIGYHNDNHAMYAYGEYLGPGWAWDWLPDESVTWRSISGRYCSLALDSADNPHMSYYLLNEFEDWHYLAYSTTALYQPVVIDVTTSDLEGHFSVTINAGEDKGAPVTDWWEVDTTNIASYTGTLTDGDMVLEVEGQLEDPSLPGQIVLQVDPPGEIVTYSIDIEPLSRDALWNRLVEIILAWPTSTPTQRAELWEDIVEIILLWPTAP